MQLSLNFTKTVHENAAVYYEKAKKAKKKLEGAKKALEISKQKLEEVLKQQEQTEKKEQEEKEKSEKQKQFPIKKEWYEKFHWFFSSEGFLVIGGRDVITNEIVVKKHTEPKDIIFHTDLQGSPFFVVKTEGKTPGEKTLQEAAAATVLYSRAWKLSLGGVKVGWVAPEQVSKTTQHGEYVTRGAFVIYGKMHYVAYDMRFALGIKGGKIIGGPYNAIAAAEKFLEIVPGEEKPSDVAKEIRKIFGVGTLDEIIRMLPSGGCKIKK